MSKNIENEICILVEFPKEDNKILIGFRDWLGKNYDNEDDLHLIINENKLIKINWPENYKKIDIKKYLQYPEKYNWTNDVEGKILSIGTFTEMAEQLKSKIKCGKLQIEKSERKKYTKKTYYDDDDDDDDDDDKDDDDHQYHDDPDNTDANLNNMSKMPKERKKNVQLSQQIIREIIPLKKRKHNAEDDEFFDEILKKKTKEQDILSSIKPSYSSEKKQDFKNDNTALEKKNVSREIVVL